MNWKSIPFINFSKPWWSSSTVEELQYKDKIILAIGDLPLSTMYKTYCYFFNKNLTVDYGMEDIYQLVKDGKWTIDKVSELTKEIYTDLDNNGVRDQNDFYGFTQDLHSLDMYLWAFENPVMKKDSEGVPVLAINTPKIHTALEKLNTLCTINIGTYFTTTYMGKTGDKNVGRDLFEESRTVIAPGYFDMAVKFFRAMEDDYGIVPMPKFDETQDRYYSMTGGSMAGLAVPKTLPEEDYKFFGTITEALSAESWKVVHPAYYDVALKVKGTRDETSVEMIDLVMESRVYDFGYIYDNWKGMAFTVQKLISQGNTNFASYYEANGPAAEIYYNKILEAFEKMN